MNELILVIVNAGFSDDVMGAAKKVGAKGGTVVNARGTGAQEAEKRFNITITPEKELIMILVEQEIRDAVLKAIYDKVGLDSPGQGIAFSLPVDEVVGGTISKKEKQIEEKN